MNEKWRYAGSHGFSFHFGSYSVLTNLAPLKKKRS